MPEQGPALAGTLLLLRRILRFRAAPLDSHCIFVTEPARSDCGPTSQHTPAAFPAPPPPAAAAAAATLSDAASAEPEPAAIMMKRGARSRDC